MARRDIVQDNDPLLRKISRNVEVYDGKLAKLLDDMRETLDYAEGAGLAGPQVGILRRVAIIEVGDFYLELINPVIVKSSGEQIDYEGCLSVKNRSCYVNRPMYVTVEYNDRKGTRMQADLEGYIARACCHELDHLDGILFYDKEYKGKID